MLDIVSVKKLLWFRFSIAIAVFIFVLAPVERSVAQVDSFPAALKVLIKPHVSIDTNVAGSGISASGRVYTWYRDGTVTAGSRTSLDDYSSPYTYSVPPGKTPNDIVAMAINKSDRVYTWYRDRTRSVGTSRNLDAYDPPRSYSLPGKGLRAQYQPEDIVGITISKFDQVRTYFKDGTSATGTSTSLGATGNGIVYAAAGNRAPQYILSMATVKGVLPTTYTWYKNGMVSTGTQTDLGSGTERAFSQHITLYSFKKLPGQSEPGSPIISGPGPIKVVRDNLADAHEPVLAPGLTGVAIARGGSLVYYLKTGEATFDQPFQTLFADYMNGTNDPVLDINSFTGLGNCKSYPQTEKGNNFCIFQVYDTRAAYDTVGNRFVFLANSRNFVWQNDEPKEDWDNKCSRYLSIRGGISSDEYCDKGRRHLMIAVSASADLADGFHLYGVKVDNYRDWPLLSVQKNQLIVGHGGVENKDGYLALVFNLEDMRNGARRPRYFRIDKSDLEVPEGEKPSGNIGFPRLQDDTAPLTVGIAYNRHVYGFPKTAAGYEKPDIFMADGKVGTRIANYVYTNGALRVTPNNWDSIPASENEEPIYEIYYGRYPLITSLTNGLTLSTTSQAGARPYAPIALPQSDYRSFKCARLATTAMGHEVIAFAGVAKKSARTDFATYDAALVKRQPGPVGGFEAPVAWKAGEAADSNSQIKGDTAIVNRGHCQQQGGAERDPIDQNRIWLMYNYGTTGKGIKAALGWIELK